ncbi:efflux RND transporter periplasmic adaptor subunit [Shewanella marina]|uniref:efflux RND transporter periplasmic adaptor subunit n=1 Tax=Shewanella marina TaxID=487319 RepID=UPI000472B69D|nr:efflux RND transporter periplasmic adaptor subunit [Shewanella marina]
MRQLVKITSVVCMALGIAACEPKTEAPKGAGAPHSVPVTAVEVKSQSQSLMVELPGRTKAFLEAEVRPQVSGIIAARNFVEGGEVKAGESLYSIDDSTYKANVYSAEAELERANAALSASSSTYKRYQKLVKTNAISQEQYDTADANYKQGLASVAQAKANLNNARINLAYTKVAAPISGRIGQSNVTPGALVTANQGNALATVQQLDPINVDIVQSSTEMLRLKQQLASGALDKAANANVSLILEDGSNYKHIGQLKFTELSVNETTGSVIIRAQFPNPEGLLLPGMFVRTQLSVGIDPQAILVPQKGVTRNPKGQGVVMVVNSDNKVEAKIVTTGGVINNQWVITSGLAAGDKVIVEGLQKIRPGAPVTATLANATNSK